MPADITVIYYECPHQPAIIKYKSLERRPPFSICHHLPSTSNQVITKNDFPFDNTRWSWSEPGSCFTVSDPLTFKITLSPQKLSKIDSSRILNLNVGVLGHVDSKKTSLVKTLQTLLSTASLDKSSQSRQRGITLDLGCSAFIMPLPPSISQDDRSIAQQYDLLQITLVDCPGHAIPIRTIIGGTYIIDMVLLGVDATKGVQTHTAECIVIAEMTTQKLIVVLDKIELFAEEGRDNLLKEMETSICAVLKKTRFANASMVGTSAYVGGEKVAASLVGDEKNQQGKEGTLEIQNIQGLLDTLQ